MHETVFAVATPAIPSPVALLRISGPRVHQLSRDLCASELARGCVSCVLALPLGRVPAVVWMLPGPATMTGEDVLEIQVPGSPDVLRQIEEKLRELGCRDAEPGEFTRRALKAGKIDLSGAEAVLQLINARDDAGLRQAMADLTGETAKRVSALTERLRRVSARFEMFFDFSEEEHAEAEAETLRTDLRDLVADLGGIVCVEESRPLRELPVVALYGPPNAGKSSLFNALLGTPRALVSETPGTTRDPVESECSLGNHRVLLVDLSGVGELDADRGRFAQIARKRATGADVLLVLNAPNSEETLREFRRLEDLDRSVRSRALWVFTKSDLADPSDAGAGIESVRVSAASGAGLEELQRRLIERLNQVGAGGATSLLRIKTREAHALLQQALDETAPPEVAASDVRRALILMDEALLNDAPGDVLDLIFSRFCIGK